MGLFEGFLHPLLAFGTALAAVPLIIHLLNRQRHKPLAWAAVSFVLTAYKKTRRRVQVENLLLLFLRMAAVALFALAVARPFTSAGSPLAGLTENRRDVVMILDGSASTGYRTEVETVFERIVNRSKQFLDEDLDAARGDRVRLILAGGYPRLLSWTGPEKAASLLDPMTTPTDEPLDLAAALAETLELAREDAGSTETSRIEVRLLTDLQRRAFLSEVDSEDDGSADREPTALVDQLDGLKELGVRVLVEDLGPSESSPPNLAVTTIEPLSAVLGPSIPFDLAVSVRNFGDRAASGTRVVIEVDGERRPNELIDVPAHGEAQAVFTLTFKTAGPHIVRASVDADRLTFDDTRAQVVSVPPTVRVLGVNGAPNPDRIEEDELGLLRAVLEPVADDGAPPWVSASPFELFEVSPAELAGTSVSLFDYDIIWLANVASLTSEATARLETRIAAGASLVVSLGDNVNPTTYNSRLFRADGSGLLPAELDRLVSIASLRGNYFRVKEFEEEHPALAFFAAKDWRSLLTEMPIYQFLAVRELEDASVLARFDDEGGHPLLIERAYDRGRVFLWTTTIDPAWTMLPEIPRALIPFVHELLRYAGHVDSPPHNLSPGESMLAEVAAFPREMTLFTPDGTPRQLEGTPIELAPNRWRLPAVSGKDTESIGAYRIATDIVSVPFAVTGDPTEGDLARMTADELESMHPTFAVVGTSDGERDSEQTQPPRGELWRWLALAGLITLITESLFAAWIGLRRRAA